MRKLILPFLLALFIFNCSNDDIIFPENILDDDVILLTQTQVDSFGALNFTRIQGSLTIGDPFVRRNIRDLSPLRALQTVDNNLTITNTSQLTSLQGLNNLTTVNNRLSIARHGGLETINALDNLRVVGAFGFGNNPKLTSPQGLRNITETSGDLTLDFISVESISGILNNLVSIKGNLDIRVGGQNTRSLDGLNNLRTIDRTLTINSGNFNSITGFQNLQIANQIVIQSNNNLTSIDGFNNLLTAENIIIVGNERLTSIDAFNGLQKIDGIQVSNNDILKSLIGFENLGVASLIAITDNSKLTSLETFNNIQSLDALLISNNNSLISIQSFSNLVEISQGLVIRSNPMLSSLDGFNALERVLEEEAFNFQTGIFINENVTLFDFCSLQSLFTNNTSINTDISGNAFNPSIQDIIDGNCSQ